MTDANQLRESRKGGNMEEVELAALSKVNELTLPLGSLKFDGISQSFGLVFESDQVDQLEPLLNRGTHDESSWIIVSRKQKHKGLRPHNHVLSISDSVYTDSTLSCPSLGRLSFFSDMNTYRDWYINVSYSGYISLVSKKSGTSITPKWNEPFRLSRLGKVVLFKEVIYHIKECVRKKHIYYCGYRIVIGDKPKSFSSYYKWTRDRQQKKARKMRGTFSSGEVEDDNSLRYESLAVLTSTLVTGLTGMLPTEESASALQMLSLLTNIGAILTSKPGVNRALAISTFLLNAGSTARVADLVKTYLYEPTSIDGVMCSGDTLVVDPLFAPGPVKTGEELFSDGGAVFSTLQSVSDSIKGPIFDHIDTLIALFVTIGFVSEEKVTISGVKLFQTGFSKQCSNRDILCRVIDAVRYLAKVGQRIFDTQSFAPLMSIEDDLTSFAKNVNEVCTSEGLYLQGNYELFTGHSETYFMDFIDKVTEQGERVRLMYASGSVAIIGYIRQLQTKLQLAAQSVRIDQLARGSRVRPFCIKFAGDTGVGKSYLNLKTAVEILAYNGFPHDKRNVCVTSNEKFDSTHKTNSTCVILDDLCNTKCERETVNPVERIIRFVNNVSATANKAEAHEKGKVLMMPKVCAITTNDEELSASFWSVNKGSVLRRIDVHVKAYLRPSFVDKYGMLDSKKAIENFSDEEVSDIYVLNVTRFNSATQELEPIPFQHTSPAYAQFDGQPMIGVSFPMFLDFIYGHSKRHFNDQVSVLSRLTSTHQAKRCDRCKMCLGACTCDGLPNLPCTNPNPDKGKKPRKDAPKEKNQRKFSGSCSSGLMSYAVGKIVAPYTEVVNKSIRRAISETVDCLSPKPFSVVRQMYDPSSIFRAYHDKWYAWYNILPTSVVAAISSTCVGKALIGNSIDEATVDVARRTFSVVSFFTLIGGLLLPPRVVSFKQKLGLVAFLPLACTCVNSVLKRNAMVSYFDSLVGTKTTAEEQMYNSMTTYLNSRQGLKANMLTVFKFAIAGGTICWFLDKLYSVVIEWNTMKGTNSGELNPLSLEAYTNRNQERNVYAGFTTPQISTTNGTLDDRKRGLAKNLVFIVLRAPGDKTARFSNAVWLRNDELMFNAHLLHPGQDFSKPRLEEFEFKIVKAPTNVNGKYQFGSEYKFFKPGLISDVTYLANDWVVLKTHGISGDVRDLTKKTGGKGNFTTKADLKKRHLVCGLHRNSAGEIYEADESLSMKEHFEIALLDDEGRSLGSKIDYLGALFKSKHTWKKGMCGSIFFDRGLKDYAIIGFYSVDRRDGSHVLIVITQEDIDAYVQTSNSFTTNVCTGVFSSVSFGITTNVEHEVPAHSPLRFSQANVHYFGNVTGSNHYKTDLRQTKAHSMVSERFNLKYEPPDFVNTRPFDDWLKTYGEANKYMNMNLLEVCKKDYLRGLKEVFDRNLIKGVKPLTQRQIVNGIPGVRFLDPMNKKSAIGYPFTGKLKKHLVQLEDPDGIYFDFANTHIWEDFERMHDIYRSRSTLCQPFRASLKDEIRKSEKTKPRVFFAAPLSIKLFMRKYFLPLTRFLSSFPLASECAVGINCMSDEWEQMMSHVETFGKDRIVAGDFKNWDIGFEKELSITSYEILIELARWFGYSPDDILIMEGIAQDLCNPTLNLFGSIIQIAGSNPSGQNLTAYVNGIGNSLRLRYFSFLHVGEAFSFRDNFRMITYGDDFKATVSLDVDFSYRDYKRLLATHNIVLTLPDKSDEVGESPLYLDEANDEFLKRKSVYLADLGYRVGALDIRSIWKSFLFYNCKSCETEPAIVESTAQSALFELVAHGEEYYNFGKGVIKDIFALYELDFTKVDIPYDNKIKSLSKDYLKQLATTDYSSEDGALVVL